MKVGTEIRSLKQLNDKIIKTAATAAESLRSRRYGFFKTVFLGAVLLNITLLPINVSLGVSQAAVDAADPDPAHAEQMRALIQAVQSGQDSDPVHAQQVAEYLGRSQAQPRQPQPDAPGEPASGAGAQSSADAGSPLRAMLNDGDPAHAEQMRALIKAVQSGADTDPVHVAQVSAYTGQTGAAPAPQPAQEEPRPQAGPGREPAPAPAGLSLYVNPYSPAARQAREWRSSNPGDAQKMDYLAAQPTARWFGNWSSDVEGEVSKVVNAAKAAGQTPVLVAYNIPNRDCGGYSQGGSGSRDDYTRWIGAFARGIGQASAIVILEPDALAGLSCLSQAESQARTDMLASALSILKSNAGTRVYVDAGHAGWVDAAAMAARLQAADVGRADGFALNVSNFDATDSEIAYGTQLSRALGGKHFVIDTSRNGNGSDGQWCNPSGRAVGQAPTVNTGNDLVDAYLWVKTPGESDGTCNGGPSAGNWWPAYALSLVK